MKTHFRLGDICLWDTDACICVYAFCVDGEKMDKGQDAGRAEASAAFCEATPESRQQFAS